MKNGYFQTSEILFYRRELLKLHEITLITLPQVFQFTNYKPFLDFSGIEIPKNIDCLAFLVLIIDFILCLLNVANLEETFEVNNNSPYSIQLIKSEKEEIERMEYNLQDEKMIKVYYKLCPIDPKQPDFLIFSSNMENYWLVRSSLSLNQQEQNHNLFLISLDFLTKFLLSFESTFSLSNQIKSVLPPLKFHPTLPFEFFFYTYLQFFCLDTANSEENVLKEDIIAFFSKEKTSFLHSILELQGFILDSDFQCNLFLTPTNRILCSRSNIIKMYSIMKEFMVLPEKFISKKPVIIWAKECQGYDILTEKFGFEFPDIMNAISLLNFSISLALGVVSLQEITREKLFIRMIKSGKNPCVLQFSQQNGKKIVCAYYSFEKIGSKYGSFLFKMNFQNFLAIKPQIENIKNRMFDFVYSRELFLNYCGGNQIISTKASINPQYLLESIINYDQKMKEYQKSPFEKIELLTAFMKIILINFDLKEEILKILQTSSNNDLIMNYKQSFEISPYEFLRLLTEALGVKVDFKNHSFEILNESFLILGDLVAMKNFLTDLACVRIYNNCAKNTGKFGFDEFKLNTAILIPKDIADINLYILALDLAGVFLKIKENLFDENGADVHIVSELFFESVEGKKDKPLGISINQKQIYASYVFRCSWQWENAFFIDIGE